MSIGLLQTLIVLDEPGKIHCGAHDPVLGYISIQYLPSQNNPNTELFGPLKVFVTLHGRAKTKVWVPTATGNNRSLYRGRAPLFSRKVLIYDAAFRAQPRDVAIFPFSLIFPETADGTLVDALDFTDEDSNFICRRDQPLPPSFQSNHTSYNHKFEAFVEYRVGVDVVISQLPVGVSKPDKFLEPVVHYERPRASRPVSRSPYDWRGYISINNELLLPESERPSGFRQKTKAFFGTTHFPTYAFDWVCTVPPDLYLGQPACFEVRILPRERECTTTLMPEVFLHNFEIEIKAHVNVRTVRSLFQAPKAHGSFTVFQIQGNRGTEVPFSQASESIKVITTPALGPRTTAGAFSSSFATYNISLTYTMKVRLEFRVTNKTTSIHKEFGVTVHPPLGVATPPPIDAGNETFDLPPYEPLPPYTKTQTHNM
ncbi:hypothetical protein GGR50DRAFT_617222 [Xylaria sp. CBS 124048]|nr:hypothetical protein GGR50DRAFT_617222 [Xylaria sp. CBS 124048]